MPGYLADRTLRRLVPEIEEGCVVPQYEFNFRTAHSYRMFPRLLQLLFCRRYDDRGKRTLQDALGECNCKTGNPLNVCK